MRGLSTSIRRTVCNQIDELETEQLAVLSLFVFVLLTTFVTMIDLVSFDRLSDILGGVEVWDVGGADDDGDGLPMYRAIFPVEPNRDAVIPKLGRLAFVVVIGQIINETNQKLAGYRKNFSLFGIGLYLFLLLLIQGERYEVAWVLAVQFFTLACYGFGFALVALAPLWSPSSDSGLQVADTETRDDMDESEDSSTSDESPEKRPRIRSSRN